MDSASFIERRKFIVKLGKMLHKYGAPSYRLEAHLTNVAKLLGVGAAFAVSPTVINFVIWIPGEDTEYTLIARVLPGDVDLGSLSRTDEIVDALETGNLSLSEASARLDEIAALPNPYSRLATFFAFGASGAAFALLMRASWIDVLFAGLLSLVVYGFVLAAERSQRISKMLEPLVALVSAFLATGIAAYGTAQLQVPLVVLASIIVFIPGLSLTLGLAELGERHLVSGSARIMDALMMLFKLYFGAYLGVSIGQFCFGKTAYISASPVPAWSTLVAVAILSSALLIVFKARAKHAPWAILAGFIAYTSSYIGGIYFGLALGAFAGALAVGVYGNAFTRFANAPASIVILNGMLVLVPGSKTYIGLNAFISGEAMLPLENLGQQTFLIFMSLVAGFIFANVVLPPKKTL